MVQDYVVTDVAGQSVLTEYWIDQFGCPWFRTFDEAVTANPGSEFDRVFAPQPFRFHATIRVEPVS